MDKDIVIQQFNDLVSGQRKEICFSKGYETYEEMYKLFKEDFDIERKEKKEIGWTLVTLKKGE
jgi:hypothetical protein